MNFYKIASRTLNYHIYISYNKIKYATLFTIYGYYCNFKKQNKIFTVNSSSNEQFDVAVIGGGSAGIQFSLDAADLGLKVILFDYVEKSKLGNTWGLGGTCVNVGCIPKKLLHISGQISESISESIYYGQNQIIKSNLNWSNFTDRVRNYICDTNIFYEALLMEKGVKYINALASIKDKNTIVFSQNKEEIQQFITDKKVQNLEQINCKYIVIASGGRPSYNIDCPNIEKYALTSDDIFYQKKQLGKTLIIGGGYIALELAGILGLFGNDVTLMSRGDFLKNFDKKITQMVLSDLSTRQKIEIKQFYQPVKIEKNPKDNLILIDVLDINNNKKESQIYENVILAIGRKPNLQYLNLDELGVKYNKQTNKIICKHNDESTSVDNIYAIGDIVDGRPELTSVAVKSAKILAIKINEKMSKNFSKIQNLDYSLYPTTLFTPIEYSFCGLTQEQAIEQYGAENITIYHSRNIPLEQTLIQSEDSNKKKYYFKVICDKKNEEKVIGLHLYGQNSSEIMQGFYIAMNTGVLTKSLLSSSFGIHPTNAEEFTNLTKQIHQNPDKDSC